MFFQTPHPRPPGMMMKTSLLLKVPPGTCPHPQAQAAEFATLIEVRGVREVRGVTALPETMTDQKESE